MTGNNFDDFKLSENKTTDSSLICSNITIKKYILVILTLTIFAVSVLLVAISSVKLQANNEVEFTTKTISTTTMIQPDPFGPGPWENSTLPDTIIPYIYNLEIRVYPNLNSYEGKIKCAIYYYQ